MPSPLDNLQITSEKLEDLVDLDTSTLLAIDFCRVFIFRNYKRITSLLITEVFSFILSLIFIMPVTLIVLRNSESLPNNTEGVNQLLGIIIGISGLCILIWNLYLWRQAKQVKSLAKLMDEIEKYNSVIQGIDMIEKLELARNADPQTDNINNKEEVFEALKITQESLISALKVEEIIRKHKNLMARRYELLANLENNLVTLMSFDTSNQESEYGHLLNEAMQIGMSVHREVKKLKKFKG